jgi:hypothetical protein
MNPDRTNYEIWLIDYIDGTLDKDRASQLISFLDENPDIKEELSDIITCNLKPVSCSFSNKTRLKKSAADLSDKQFEYLCIASLENDLSESQKAELEAMISENQEKKKTFDLFKRTILVAPELQFRKKSDLRKFTLPQKIIRLSVIGLSAAAGIALFITLFNMSGKKEEINMPIVSQNISRDTGLIMATSPLPLPLRRDRLSTGEFAAETPGSMGKFTKTKPSAVSTTPTPVNPIQPASKENFEHVSISKLDYKPDVHVGSDIPSDIIAIKTHEIPSPGTIEKPVSNGFIAKVFRERILKNKGAESGSLKAYEVADAGIIGLNKLLGWQMSLDKTRDETGELKSLYFSSKILKFNAPVKKTQLEP